MEWKRERKVEQRKETMSFDNFEQKYRVCKTVSFSAYELFYRNALCSFLPNHLGNDSVLRGRQYQSATLRKSEIPTRYLKRCSFPSILKWPFESFASARRDY